ncbi:MAG TPA: carbohydrate kinase family protein [Balneolaceae bacterium]|nr:carbohydrate kinase family protein [Balneolaceae bacterium]
MPNKKQGTLLVIGELNMDMILDNIESFPELGKEKIASDFSLTLGSSSAIFAGNIARLGVKTTFCGMIGDDGFGTKTINQLQEYGVDTSLVKKSDTHKTGLTVIMRYSDDRAMLTYPGAMEHFSFRNIPANAFENARHLHISSIFLQPGIKKDLFKIIETAKSRGMTVSVDPQWDPDERWDLNIKKLIENIDFFLPNEAEFLSFTSASTVEQGLEELKPYVDDCTIVVKRGGDGATFLNKQGICTVPAFINEDIRDAVGAGDSFNAGLIFRFLQGDPIEKCIRFGNITGAVSTTETGGTGAISSLDDVLNIAKNKLSITNLDDFTR